MEKNKLFLIDAMAMIYRAFYAMNKSPRINSKGLDTSAAFGFFNTLLSLLKQYKPTHIGIAFDLHGPTFRHKEFADYKSNRQATPDEIRQMEPYIRDIIDAMHIPILLSEGYEADDVIGTLAKQAAKQGFEVYMVTPDKDYAQLVEENVKILKLGRMGSDAEIWGVDEVLQKFEIEHPKQVIDILGLWGDSSDNILGVPGVGEKKAKALLKQFHSIEEAIERCDEIESKSLRNAISENKELALQSKFLATIVLDVPVEFDAKEFEVKQPDFESCKRLFEELEFKTFSKKFFEHFGIDETAIKKSVVKNKPAQSMQPDLFSDFSSCQSFETINKDYVFIDNFGALENLVKHLQTSKLISFHCNEVQGKLIGISFSSEKGKADFVSLFPLSDENLAKLNLLRELFEDENITKIVYDLKREKHILADYDCLVKGNCFDVQLAHYLLDSEVSHRLDFLSEKYLSYRMADGDSLTKEFAKSLQTSVLKMCKSQFSDYCSEIADVLFQLKDILETELKNNDLYSLFADMELPLVDVLFSMEQNGVRIDSAELAEFSKKLGTHKTELENQIYAFAGEKFNISSPKQLSEILFTRLQIVGDDKKKKTNTKQLSTAEDVLQKLASVHPIVPLILEYRKITKLKSTYVDALPALVNPKTGRLHTSYNQAVTATGRLSSNNPNLQNIPIRTDLGKEIRKCFIPANEDFVLLAADYSQIELRIIASLSEDEHLCDAFRAGEDIHLATAAKIYGMDKSEISKEQRANVKSVNFGIIYGISSFGLAQQLGVSRKEASDLIEQYFESYPRVKQYIESCKENAREKGYAQSMCGRRRYLKDINSLNGNLRAFAERNAVNMPVQASSADMIKLAMIGIYRRMQTEGLQSKMIMQVHDELVFDVYKPELEQMRLIVKEEMVNALKLNIPIVVEMNSGENWLAAH
ncbi:MAG: DNA polymerase I [Bacteroidales bacterium]|nr:DNA polymerase I [Bacteroidales bacterium]